jgi:septum formation protein
MASARDGDNWRKPLILASGSPRRLALLQQIGLEPTAVIPAEVDETPGRSEAPRLLAGRLAREKAHAARKIAERDEATAGGYLIAADTVVALGRRVLPKTELVDEASTCLRLLSGRAHRVYTGVTMVTPKGAERHRLVETRVRFKRLSKDDLDGYLGSGEWRGKAGGYAIQGIAGAFVTRLIGSYSNVVGLPLYEVATLLGGEGYPIHLNWLNRV